MTEKRVLDLADVPMILDLPEQGRVKVAWPRFIRGDDVYESGGRGQHPAWVNAAISALGVDHVDADVRRWALDPGDD